MRRKSTKMYARFKDKARNPVWLVLQCRSKEKNTQRHHGALNAHFRMGLYSTVNGKAAQTSVNKGNDVICAPKQESCSITLRKHQVAIEMVPRAESRACLQGVLVNRKQQGHPRDTAQGRQTQ